MGAEFRQALSARRLAWAVGIPRHQKVYPRDVELVFPVAARGRPRKRPNEMVHARLAQGNEGTSEGLLRRRPRARRRRAAATDRWQGGIGQIVFLLAGRAPLADLGKVAATIKARWVCEQAHQQLKEELGLDHFEGRSWRGLHRHALMAMIAYAFLQHRRLAAASGGKKIARGPPNAAGHTKSHRRSPGARSALPMPALPPTNPRSLE